MNEIRVEPLHLTEYKGEIAAHDRGKPNAIVISGVKPPEWVPKDGQRIRSKCGTWEGTIKPRTTPYYDSGWKIILENGDHDDLRDYEPAPEPKTVTGKFVLEVPVGVGFAELPHHPGHRYVVVEVEDGDE